jgi:citrate lyase synthetase
VLSLLYQSKEIHLNNITISHEFVNELQEVIEDSVEYTISEFYKNGELISGETAWKCIEALAVAKQAQFQGLID